MSAQPTAPEHEDASARRRALMRELLAERSLRAEKTEQDRIPRAPRPADSFPLTSTQRRMWFGQRLNPEDTSATLCRALRLRGPLDVDALARACARLVARHEVLRSTFDAEVDGEPRQRVHSAPERVLEVLDGVGAAELAERFAGRPFDLAAEFPLRLALSRLGADDHVLLLVVHHVAADDASWTILVDELAAGYRAGDPDGRAEPELQVGDVAVWQAGRAGGPDEREDQLYWRERLEGLPEPVAPPRDFLPDAGGAADPDSRDKSPRLTGQITPTHEANDPDSRGVESRHTGVGWVGAELGTRVDEAVSGHARARGTTPFAVLFGALAVVLHRRTGATDIAVGSPVSGRDRAELAGVVGDFGNTVVLRVSLAGDPGFGELLDRVREVVTGALAHQELPFDAVVERLNRDRAGRVGAEDLFRVMFLTYDDRFGSGEPFGPEIAVAEERVPAHASQFDLTVAMSRGAGGLHAESTYRGDRYAPETVASLFPQVAAVLLGDPEVPVSRLPLGEPALGSPEPVAPGREPAPVPVEVPHLAERVSAELLGRAANQLTRELLARGAGPERSVVVALPPSVAMVTAQLAIHQAGAVHVPVDPRHPAARTAHVVAGADPLVVITERAIAERLGDALGDAPHLLVDGADAVRVAERPAEPVEPGELVRPPHPDDAAYVIHTSGSTGRPKGVVVTRANLAAMLAATDAALPGVLGPGDVWSVTHSAAFDFSVWEIWGAMYHGSRLVLVDPETVREPRALARLVTGHGVTVLSQTPSAFAGLVAADAEDPGLLAGSALRLVLFGGEPLPPELVRRWYSRHPDRGPLLVNMFGITETTVHASVAALSADGVAPLPGGAAGTPIGQALPGQWLDVVDPAGRPVPTGVLGELWVGGPGVTRGYLGDPARTAARFVAAPGGRRRYRSGDLARRAADGTLCHLGRIDDQISLRGYRIEPGEVAASVGALLDIPAARVAVLVREVAGDPRLVAVVATEGLAPGTVSRLTDVDLLRAELAGRLTQPMVPSAFATVPRLPLTASGKLDRRELAALPLPGGGSGAGPTTGSRPPEGPVEQTVAALFAELLGVPEAQVGADSDFFALGGHSLLAVRLAAGLRAAFPAGEGRIDVRTVFDAPTVAGIARLAAEGEAGPDTPALSAKARPERVPVAELAHGLWFLHRVDPASPAYHVPIGLELSGALDVPALRAALNDVVARQESLRTIYPRGPRGAEQVILPEHRLELAEHADLAEEELDALLAEPFDLAAAPPVRALLLRRGPDRHTLMLCLHHIAADEGSLGPLLADLGAAYAARAAGGEPDWAPLPVHYADWARWHRELLDTGGRRAGQRDYWTRTLAGVPERLELPLDRPRPATRDSAGKAGGTGRAPSSAPDGNTAGAHVDVRIDPELRAGLARLAAEHGVSTFMVLHAALAALLTRFGAGEDITVGSPVGRRTDPALAGVVGYLVNTVVLRTDIGGDPSFAELLARVRRTALEAYAHADLPFEQVVEAVAPRRGTSSTPLFQVMLSYAAGALPEPSFPGLVAEVAPRATPTAKFDLTLNLAERSVSGTSIGAEVRGGIEGILAYRTDVFDRPTAERLVAALLAVLRQACADPARPIGELDVLGPDRDRVVREWNDTAAPVPAEDVLDQIRAAAAARPDAPAVVTASGDSVSYRELLDRAARVATLIHRRLGAAPGRERYVGVLLPRSPELVAALLGVLAADAAFVPIDAGLPAARVAELVAGLDGVITDATHRPKLGEREGVIELDLGGIPADPPPRRGQGAHGPEGLRAAYVIHTSGSSGVPKSAVILHRAIASRMAWQRAKLSLGVSDAVLHKAPLTFDISINELLLPLTAGARLVLAEPDRHGDLAHLVDVIDRHEVTFVYLVASMLEVLLDTPSFAARAGSLRHLWCGGEKLTADLLSRTRAALPVTLYHGYGPAEATIGVCSETHPAADPGEITEVTLGRPNPNTALYVLDARLRPVPPGVPGELYIGGILLGRGYRADPKRTAERFVASPFTRGERLYATGDLARYRADGRLEFLGRRDNQVKVRGARVELEEVEAVLAAHPGVRRAAAVLVPRPADRPASVLVPRPASGPVDPGRDARLAVAWVPEPSAPAPDRAGALDWLRERLPAAAVPTLAAPVTELPLRPSGKVDRAVLAGWLAASAPEADTRPPEPPQGELEERIAQVWAEALGLPYERIGARHGFFELGGNSLLMVVVQQRLAERIGREPALLDLLAHPTVSELAALLEGSAPDRAAPDPALQRTRERAGRARRAAGRRTRG